ncbi:MAG: zf-HC2 domain-containing protein [Clostridiales bacterium]|nr:zf-HC2 domain-containing protein [Clostridiales bacterium]
MKTELNCNIVRDMLPLYAENLSSEESNRAIRQHLNQCENCQEYFKNMQNPIDCPEIPQKEIDYMKKVKQAYKRRTYILVSVIAAVCIVSLGIFLRFFIMGSPVFLGEAPINYKWSYDTQDKIYSIHGTIGKAQTGARIKVYEDKQSNQTIIKVYELVPSIFFPEDDFSVQIPWNGETDIVWQGKYNQQVIMSAQYMNLCISEFKDNQYKNVVDVFDMKAVDSIRHIFENSAEVSDTLLDAFDEKQYDNYINILLPSISGTYATWVTDESALQEKMSDERIFLYQENGKYYFYKEGQKLKIASEQDTKWIFDYINKK